jgi:4-amino-4-deoxy-L-arabinose transferase-like glycosyltransferase
MTTTERPGERPEGTRKALLALAVILLLAAALRLWHLGTLPPGFQFDEAHNALDAARVLKGDFQPFFTDNGGREPLNIYLYALAIGLLGRPQTVFAIRLVSALTGLLTVLALFGFVARCYRDRFLGVLAAGFLAVSYWHVHFSRYAIRAVFAPLWAIGAVWAWWAAVARPVPEPGGTAGAGGVIERLRALAPALACGLCLALAFYSHPTGRLLPLVLLGHALYRTVADRGGARRVWTALATAGATALVLSLPLLAWFARNPGAFTAHPSDVSLTALAAKQYGGNVLSALAHNLGAVLGMFFLHGDPSTFHNLPGLPVFDPLSALLFVIGLGVFLGALVGSDRAERDRAVLLGLWLGVMLVPTLFSDRPPNYSRAVAALPIVALLPALGLRWLLARLPDRLAGWRWLAAATVLVVAGAWTAWHYFGDFARLPQAYYSYDADKIDALRALDGLARDANVFLHPLWAEHATIAYLNKGGPVKKLDGTDTLVVPGDGRDVVVAFPAKEARREKWLERAQAVYGSVAQVGEVRDGQGKPALATLRVPAAAIGDMKPPTDAPLEPQVWTAARFGGMIELLGYSVGAARPGEPLPITLVWRAQEPVVGNWTTFVHLLGPGEQPVGQQDREPANASYRTTRWQPGDVIIDRFTPVLAPDARGPVTIRVGLYDQATGQRLTMGEMDEITLKPVELAP